MAIRNSLVLRHMGLVHQIANRYSALVRDSSDDLVQEGCLGLIRAIERFEPDYGVQFSTYAYPVISGTIKNHLRDRRRLVGYRRPDEADADAVSAAREELVSPESLEALSGDLEDDFTEHVVDRLLAGSLLTRLPRLEGQIVKHFFYDDLTQREVAVRVARSTSRISRILRRALERIRLLLLEVQQEEGRLVYAAGPQIEVVMPPLVDPDTGLFGPEHLQRSLAREVSRAKALAAPLSVVLFRPDLAPAPVTSADLAEAARLIYQQVRVLDHVFRAGLEDLAVILSLPPREAASVCHRLRQGAPSLKVHHAIVTYPQDAASSSNLLRAARERLAQEHGLSAPAVA